MLEPNITFPSPDLIDAEKARAADSNRYWVLIVLTLVYAVNIADRFMLSTLIEPIKAEFKLSDSGVAFLTGTALALFYVAAGIPLGRLADKTNRRNMIAIALTIWSAMTAFCGMAQSYAQLLVARMGVGVGEAGGTPPSQSLLADYFPPQQRILSMSVFALGIPAGIAFGGIAAGYLAQHYNWRSALFASALLGVPVVLMLLFVKEPKRGQFDTAHDAPKAKAADVMETLRYIKTQKPLLHIIIGCTLATFSGQGVIWWTPAFLGRSHGMNVEQAGLTVGTIGGGGGAIAMIISAFFMIYLMRFHIKWQCYFVAGLTAIITVPAVIAHMTTSTSLTIFMLWCFVPFANIYVGPHLALMQNLTPANMRGTTVAISLFTANFANLVIAPQLIGFISDVLNTRVANPVDSLRYALIVSALTGIWAAYHYIAAAKSMRAQA